MSRIKYALPIIALTALCGFGMRPAFADGISGSTNGAVGLFVNGSTEAMHITSAGAVGIGTLTPQSLVAVQAGEVQVGSSSASCAGNNAGAIRYSSTSLYYCNGTTWTALGTGSGSGTVNSATQYQMAYYATTGTAVSGDPRIVTDASDNFTVVSGNLNIGTTTATYGALNIGGQNAISYPSTDSVAFGSIAIGSSALNRQSALSSAAFHNTAIGYMSISASGLTTAAQNLTAVGYQALRRNTSGDSNAALGYQALAFNTTGYGNTAVGLQALLNTTVGALNTAVGREALTGIIDGSNNTAVGVLAGATIGSGSTNTVLGSGVASTTLNSGSSNILIGVDGSVDTPAAGTSNFLNIGNTIFATSTNTGTVASPAGNVGIGTSKPRSKLDVYNAEVQVGSSSTACIANNNGAIRYASGTVYFCTGTTWTALASGGGGSGTVNSATQYQMAYYATTGTAVSGDANVVTDASNNFQILLGSLAIGTTNVSNMITLDGQNARTIGMVREYTASTAGQNLTLTAGGAKSGGTDLAGGALILSAGLTTGVGTSGIQFQTYPAAASTASTDNTAMTALTVSAAGVSGTSAVTTLQANAGSGNNQSGGTLTLASGVSTGTGTSSMNFKVYGAGSSGSSVNSATTAMTITSNGTVAIGTTTATSAISENVWNTASSGKGVQVTVTGTGSPDGIYAVASGAANTGAAVYGINSSTNNTGYGGYFENDTTATGSNGTGSALAAIETGANPNQAGYFANTSASGGNAIFATYNNINIAGVYVLGPATTTVDDDIAHFAADANNGAAATITIENTQGLEHQAALLFAGAGVTKWAVGNDSPADQTDDFFILKGGGATIPSLDITTAGNVGIGTAKPRSKLDVYGAEVQVGSSSTACGANNAGAIRYSSTSLYYCNASSWTSLSGGGGSGTVNSATQYQMAYYAATGTAVSGDANVVTDASNNFQILLGGLGIGTSIVGSTITLDGQNPRTIGMNRDYTASTAGQNLTLTAGGAKSGGTDLAGGALILSAGLTTGVGTSGIQFQTYPAAASTASTDNTAMTALTVSATGVSGTSAVTTLQANAGSGNNKKGGTLTLASGVSTGTGTSSMNFKVYGAGSSGSAVNSATTAMTIDNTGYVGINFTTPNAPLDVNGQILVESGGNVMVNTLGAASYILNSAGNCGTLQNDSTNGWSLGWNGCGSGLGTSVLFWNTTGQVGIGTITPRSKVDIYNAEVQVGSSSAACGANNAGAIRYSSTSLYYCNASSWTSLGGGGGSGTVNSGTQYQMAYYATTGTAVSGDANVVTDASNNFQILLGGLGIGTSIVGSTITLDGQNPRTIGMNRDYTASTAGQDMTISAGGAKSGGSNLIGGNLILSSGIATGLGSSNVQFQTYPAGSTGSTDATALTALTVTATGVSGTNATTTLTANSGGSGSNKVGGNLVLSSGASTGIGSSSINMIVYPSGAGGTGANAPTTEVSISTSGMTIANNLTVNGSTIQMALTAGSAPSSGTSVAGSSGQFQYNNSGVVAGASGLTYDSTNSVTTITGGTIAGASSVPALTITETWNNATTVFTGIKENITSTASAAASLLMDLQVGGTSQFNVDKSGNATAAGHIISSQATGSLSVSSCGAGTPTVTGNDTHGIVTTGASGSTGTCTITFASAFAAAPYCVISGYNADTGTRPFTSSTTTTTLVIGFQAAVTNKKIIYICMQ